jgi:hypothetical protein
MAPPLTGRSLIRNRQPGEAAHPFRIDDPHLDAGLSQRCGENARRDREGVAANDRAGLKIESRPSSPAKGGRPSIPKRQ